eukprot:PhF_6_TR648/c0_g1_i3/m.921/K01937/pyrG, CTPS; CTP synthase
MGLQPDIIACRCDEPLEAETRSKISQVCNVNVENVISMHTVGSLFEVPNVLASQGIVQKLTRILHLDDDLRPQYIVGVDKPLSEWTRLHQVAVNPSKKIKIAFVGKYMGMGGGGVDTYFSAVKALEHSALACNCGLELVWVSSESLENTADEATRKATEATILKCDGVFMPGGFGGRGIEGMLNAVTLARKNDIPYFGVCLGMQVALIEIGRTELGWSDANSEEFDKESKHQILKFMPEIDRDTMGANMRLGAREVHLQKDSMIYQMYGGADVVMERHRHRYEFNIEYKEQFEALGVRFTAVDDKKERMEGIEVSGHPFFFAVQYHPEYKSRPFSPSPPFHAFIVAASSDRVVKASGI